MKKNILLLPVIIGNLLFSQVGINTDTPTEALDVNGSVRIRDLADPETKIVITDAEGVLNLLKPSEVFSPKAFLNNSTSATEQRLTIYDDECFVPGVNTSSCTIKLIHYSSCAGFRTPISTEINVIQTIQTGNGNFSGNWVASYLDNKGYSNTTSTANQIPPDFPRISYTTSSGTANYLGNGFLSGQCNTDFVTTITQATGKIKIESVKRSMFTHLVYLISVNKTKSP